MPSGGKLLHAMLFLPIVILVIAMAEIFMGVLRNMM
jgi:hypothetical protein